MRRLLIAAIASCVPFCFLAEERVRLLLHSGHTVNGTLIVETEEVYMLEGGGGQRLQYPASEVAAVLKDSLQEVVLRTGERLTAYTAAPQGDTITLLTAEGQLRQYPRNAIASATPASELPQRKADRSPAVGVQLTIRGGGAMFPNKALGNNLEAGAAVGYRKLQGRRFFVGAGVDFQARLHGGEEWQLLPVFARAEYYFLPDHRWSPTIGADAGYAFALKGVEKGGPIAALSLGARYETGRRRNHVQIGAYCKAVQCRTDITETIQDAVYQRKGVRGYVDFGVYLSVLL